MNGEVGFQQTTRVKVCILRDSQRAARETPSPRSIQHRYGKTDKLKTSGALRARLGQHTTCYEDVVAN